ncbi:MAG: ABC transporter permease [Eubacterium sp.]|nr:ABC transporter permease [Eubacterium sp.]
MNKKENIYSMKGFSKVFKFTLLQTFKNSGYRVTFILFVLIMAIMGPIQYFMAKNSQDTVDSIYKADFNDTTVKNVYVVNDTAVDFDLGYIADNAKEESDEDAPVMDANNLKAGNVNFIPSDKSYHELVDELGEDDAVVYLHMTDEGYEASGIIADDSKVETSDIDDAASYIGSYFEEVRLSDINLSNEEIMLIGSGVDTDGVIKESDYIAEQSKTISGQKYFSYILAFSVIIMMIISLSNSFIIASVTEEKQSKLVESLLVSVRPMALLMGKICGMMSYVLSILICGFIGSKISDLILEYGFHAEKALYSGSGFDLSVFKSFGASGLVILLISLVVGYMTFAVIGGILGSSCSKMEDTQNATGTVMTITMLGYMGGMFFGMADNNILNLVSSLLPPFSYFTAPILYVTGRIELWTLLLTFVIQLVFILLLVLLAAKTYRSLILSDSSTPKLATIFKTARM